MVAAKDFSAALPRSCASWLDWISNMSLMAACFTKSSVAGLMPRVEFIPVFSPTDWAIAGVASRTSARHGARYFILASFLSVAGRLRQLLYQSATVPIGSYRFDPNGPPERDGFLSNDFFKTACQGSNRQQPDCRLGCAEVTDVRR